MSDTIKSWLFVSVQALLLALLLFFTNAKTTPVHSVVLAGRFIELIGFIILLVSFYDLRKSLTALPLPKENGELQIHGLYKYVRHPMYVGVLMLSLGIAVSSGSVIKYLLVLALYILFSFKARYEEKLLLEKYPGYKAYMRKTHRFVPTISKN
jgi:protein-S-isoprenylcysteine O-methyltransferase Ste14